MHSGVVVAGGRSTRFGDGDKALADLAGTPMIRRVADRLAPVVDELVVNCRADQRRDVAAALDGLDVPVSFAIDTVPDRGPLAGIETGLDAVAGEYAAVVACDMPFVEPALVAHLFERAAGHEAAVPRPDEWFQTTQAVYHADAMTDACRRALDDGQRRVAVTLDALDVAVIDRDEVERHATMETFENLNTREAFEAARDRL
ncbi:molybdenum cofactor guanylyltransferase [Halomicrobium sp. IBSBa]|uniref:molybdenum cofactor guanylyltransferase n=1 Tax=Halomicrobium sp. IBSBa TaxID=2778916 RepID=UPI001ABFD5E6|nr:molybdenum cofactor guanylyltransferase [Halomicrobium sp. IBSBa]MBO4246762.1 molybdenum cofactor guanylyltransferase [Halomicrobium sp. IBSBa]